MSLRNYRTGHSEESLLLEVKRVHDGSMTVSADCKMFKIPVGSGNTLQEVATASSDREAGFVRHSGRTSLSEVEEGVIVDHIIKLEDYHLPLNLLNVRCLVKRYLNKVEVISCPLLCSTQ